MPSHSIWHSHPNSGDKERRDTVYEILLVGEWLLRTSVDWRVNELHSERYSLLR